MEQTFELGERVTFTHVILRDKEWVKQKGTVCTWVPYEAPGEGFIVGWRTLSNGTIEEYREGDGYFGTVHVENRWYGSDYFRAYIVTTDLRRNPVWVLPEHLARAS